MPHVCTKDADCGGGLVCKRVSEQVCIEGGQATHFCHPNETMYACATCAPRSICLRRTDKGPGRLWLDDDRVASRARVRARGRLQAMRTRERAAADMARALQCPAGWRADKDRCRPAVCQTDRQCEAGTVCKSIATKTCVIEANWESFCDGDSPKACERGSCESYRICLPEALEQPAPPSRRIAL